MTSPTTTKYGVSTSLKPLFRTKSFLESSGCRTHPLKTSGYWPRLTQMGKIQNGPSCSRWWYKSKQKWVTGSKPRLQEASDAGCCCHLSATCWSRSTNAPRYVVATVSRIDKIIRLFCRISSLLKGSFAKETYHFIDPTNCSHPISGASTTWTVTLTVNYDLADGSTVTISGLTASATVDGYLTVTSTPAGLG